MARLSDGGQPTHRVIYQATHNLPQKAEPSRAVTLRKLAAERDTLTRAAKPSAPAANATSVLPTGGEPPAVASATTTGAATASIPSTPFREMQLGQLHERREEIARNVDALAALPKGTSLQEMLASPEVASILGAFGVTGEAAAQYRETFFAVVDAMRVAPNTVEQTIVGLHAQGWMPPFHGALLSLWGSVAPALERLGA